MASKIWKFIFLLFVHFSLCSASNINEHEQYRLPKDVMPSKYYIELETRLAPDLDFSGNVTIEVTVQKSTNSIILHSHMLNYTSHDVTIEEEFGKNVEVLSLNFVKKFQFCNITLNRNLDAGKKYVIKIHNFEGDLRDDMHGFYKSSYKTPNGTTRWLGTTQFEPTHARSAFPCFDEPSFKATFEISIVHNESYTALSNMQVKGNPVRITTNSSGEGKLRTSFVESIKMSTYLVAFIVSDFKHIEKIDAPVKYRVYSAPDEIGQAEYALQMTPKVLQTLENYTKIPYKLEKLDQVAIPDFAAGAMENWGLVTYRLKYLLYNDTESTTRNKESILKVIVHELAHQWFGNLVTCDWWEHTWLNEGFAKYFENYITSLIEPSWRLLDRYVVDVIQDIMITDALESTRPMSHPVESPSEISNIFDGITYAKASAVIHMMAQAFGIENFARGLNTYLNTNAFSTSVPSQLFDGLASVKDITSHLPKAASVEDIFSSWSTQAGFPLVTVTRDYTSGSMTLTQERYFAVPPKEKYNTTWWIPISYTTSNKTDANPDTRPSYWMYKNGEPLKIDAQRKHGWIIVNNQKSGYYRVNYDKKNWELLTEVLKGPKYDSIHVLNRAQLIDDSLNLAKSGKVGYDLALDLMDYLEQETDFIPWMTADYGLILLDSMLDSTPAYPKFKKFVLRLVDKVYTKTSFEEISENDHTEVFNRINAHFWACKMDHDDCLKRSHARFSLFMSNPTKWQISPNLRSITYCAAIKKGGPKEWKFLWKRYVKNELPSDSFRLLYALGCTKDEELLYDYLEEIFEENSEIREEDKGRAIYSIINAGHVGITAILNVVKDKFQNLLQSYEIYGKLSMLIKTLGSEVSNEKQYNLLNDILDTHGHKLSENTTKIAKQSMDANRKWWTKNLKTVSEWLEKYNYHHMEKYNYYQKGKYNYHEMEKQPEVPKVRFYFQSKYPYLVLC